MLVKVRKAEAEDYEAWLKLWKGYLNFYESDLDESVTLSTWHRALSSESCLVCRIAEIDYKIVGFALCVLHEGTWVTQPICYLEDLFVTDDMRGMGVGTALIEAIYDESREKSWSKVYWVTRTDNPARKLYDKLAVLDDFVRYSIKI
ncbi:GNAT family N-acetyltransferase [Erwinia pyrifoliae]|uniref:GNAT family N-acetyltransferase n=1 Tax=Erwinia pyrifoliae TaxID=79967 RepID=A0ABY5X9F8_ERWPY|nr:GNAT family N-acetyltransferase [Erwinia pyrifoliae]AUX74000.1 N-acetyltransferase [Erwinia pyrifoliae]MCA8875660.1 GNAT family N-acetyltransferase [Erwinia pyrifoliae]MCT2385865.1 GNAT family N-acetyltransferase [Erwinia pyrifoliae]MCU8588558.1 GNAT family N-acetyltransferase [Erwinia pyrifoliae]UWS29703.1 GNAT family N-acetyltransferase [Erwinia pyrifoliae]